MIHSVAAWIILKEENVEANVKNKNKRNTGVQIVSCVSWSFMLSIRQNDGTFSFTQHS
jgi:hypothetical protein